MKVLIIIPMYNERENIQKVIDEVKKDLDFVDILIVNDCSTDDTLEIIKSINDINYLSLPVNLGYSGALQAGFKYAIESKYEFVIQFDGDGQHIASEARKLLDIMMQNNVDIVIGSRFKSETNYNHSFFRKIGTSLFRIIISKFCETEITDPTSGFQVLRKNVFEKYSRMNNYPEYPDANLLIEMILYNYKIEEYQVQMRSREFGESMHSGVIKPIKYMVKMFYAILLVLVKSKTTSVNSSNK